MDCTMTFIEAFHQCLDYIAAILETMKLPTVKVRAMRDRVHVLPS